MENFALRLPGKTSAQFHVGSGKLRKSRDGSLVHDIKHRLRMELVTPSTRNRAAISGLTFISRAHGRVVGIPLMCVCRFFCRRAVASEPRGARERYHNILVVFRCIEEVLRNYRIEPRAQFGNAIFEKKSPRFAEGEVVIEARASGDRVQCGESD